MRRDWHIERDGARLTLARRLPARFDLKAQVVLNGVLRRGRLAHQVRQDVWRCLQALRGFSPVVEVVHLDTEQTLVRAGGRVDGAFNRSSEDRLTSCVFDLDNQRRWVSKSRRMC